MKLSARNQIPGTVVEVRKGATMAHVVVEIAGGQRVVSSITNEAADELELAPGKPVLAVVKASDVMIGIA